ncbi:MAG: glycosyltransferase family 2 protein [Chromatiaceae bacterium]|nr:glycosyltransferase family 2 protein [Chromatiaceae bacterium]
MEIEVTNPTLTVLICTHNRSELLLRTLHHLSVARLPENWKITVLVVANACSDNTQEVISRFAQQLEGGLSLEWIAEPVPGKSHALNRAIPLIHSDLVAFVDDDHRVHPDYLVNICSAGKDYPEAGLFCGRILPDWNGSEPDWVHDTGPYRIYPLPVPRFDQGNEPRRLTPDIAIPGGGNLFLRREWLARVGPFSTELGPTGHDLEGSEDLDWVLRAQRLGALVQYIPSVVQYHYVDLKRLSLSYLTKKAFKRTATTTSLKDPYSTSRIPRYLYRKLAGYLLSALTAFGSDRRRFYIVRTAAALGEMKGCRQKKFTSENLNKS